MTAHQPRRADDALRLTRRDLIPLVGFLVPTLVTAYGLVMPRHGITGVNELTVGFASTVLGAAITYVIGLRDAIRRRAGGSASTAPRRWRRPEWIARQAARPYGPVGWLLGLVMRAETAAANDLTVHLADIAPDARVLDVGCGAGHAVRRVGEQLTSGHVVGLDPSPAMVRLAARRNRRLIAQGRAAIARGGVERVPYPPASFDRILATHTVYFWRDLAQAARELHRVLAPGGLLVLGCGDPDHMRSSFPSNVYTLRPPAEIGRILTEAGFADISVDSRTMGGRVMYWLRARRPPALATALAVSPSHRVPPARHTNERSVSAAELRL